MLQDVCDILTLAKLPYCLDGGTLLGIVREDRLLPWDTDMDLYADASNAWRIRFACLLLRLRGFTVRRKRLRRQVGPLPRGAIRIIKVRRLTSNGNSLLLDIITKHHIGDRAFWVVGAKNAVLKSVKSEFYRDTSPLSFRGQSYTAPSDLAGYLAARYGDWRTPVKKWNFMSDDHAILRN